jgi:hypothetical protein
MLKNALISDEGLYDQGWKFQSDLVAPHAGQLYLRSFSMCTKRTVIAPLMISYKRI